MTSLQNQSRKIYCISISSQEMFTGGSDANILCWTPSPIVSILEQCEVAHDFFPFQQSAERGKKSTAGVYEDAWSDDEEGDI